MSTNERIRLTGYKDIDGVIEEINNTPSGISTTASSDAEEASVISLDELRRKLCQPPPVKQKSKWRFW
jgi:hypothetical protein